jgi:hypothetical protein
MDAGALWALGVALVGVVLGAASLTWNIVAFLHSGARVKIEANQDMLLIDPVRGTQEPVVTLTVRNVGRMPCQVTRGRCSRHPEVAWLFFACRLSMARHSRAQSSRATLSLGVPL